MTMVFEVDHSGRADVHVQLVDSPGIADLLVFRDMAKASALHNEGVWCFVNEDSASSKKIHFSRKPGYKNLKVCYVKSRGLAGWIKNHQLKGRL